MFSTSTKSKTLWSLTRTAICLDPGVFKVYRSTSVAFTWSKPRAKPVTCPAPGGGGTLYNGLYGEAPPERGTFFRLQVYERVGILLVEERKGGEICYLGL